MDGCELCGDFPAHLRSVCHTSAPLRAEMHEGGILKLFCFLPECNRLVAEFQTVQEDE